MRYLPASFFRVLIVHSISLGTYRYACATRDHVHLAVGVSPRIREDLLRSFGFPAEHTIEIPNAVDSARFDVLTERTASPGGDLRVISLGRLEDR